jgi:phage-related protein
MPVIGPRCHELRINDESGTFRIMYRADTDAVVILDVCLKKTQQTPQSVITQPASAGCMNTTESIRQGSNYEEK